VEISKHIKMKRLKWASQVIRKEPVEVSKKVRLVQPGVRKKGLRWTNQINYNVV